MPDQLKEMPGAGGAAALLCPTCGEPLMTDTADFGPVDMDKPDHVVDGRPYCPNGHDAGDIGGEG